MKFQIMCAMLCLATNLFGQSINVTDFGARPDSFADATESVAKAIEASKSQQQSVIDFPTGRYDFWPEGAVETSYYISNTSSEKEVPVKKQRAGLMLKHLKNITIEGNGSTFVFHGKIITWVVDSSENVTIRNLTINYERPGMSEMTIREISASAIVATIHPDSRFTIIDDKLKWYGEKWVTENFHAILVKPGEGRLLYSSWDPFLKSNAKIIAPLNVQFTGDFSNFRAEPGDVLTIRDRYRDYVGAFINRSQNIRLHNLHMNSMHGLGIISQFSENLFYDSVFVEPAENGGRVIASSADGMHFSGCRGQILIDHCRFKGLHDDPVNVHGTHLKITEIVSPTAVKLKFMHHQTYGFQAFSAGDTVAWLHAASLEIFEQGIIKSAKMISAREILVEMQEAFSHKLQVGDAVENLTWTPSLTIRNSRFEGTVSRGTLVTTRRKVLIENNIYYRTGMHAILIENDASGWYESGQVTDVTIRNNQFIECGYNSYPDNYVIRINPQNHQMVKDYWVHKNIRIENNNFTVYDYPVLSAQSVATLTFTGNTIHKSSFLPAGEDRPSIRLIACTKVKISANQFDSQIRPSLRITKMSAADIKSDIHQNSHQASGGKE